ncbi:unnamed protein product, partial [Vitis vinifera]|uniref:beta-galactosidase n=1 Tax=Vitis vinifera TaxID=29760 RepID=D7T581_VITVI
MHIVYIVYHNVEFFSLQINTCDQFTPNSPNKPKTWTENWPGWFKTFGAPDPHGPREDIVFSIARFFWKVNYYMVFKIIFIYLSHFPLYLIVHSACYLNIICRILFINFCA